MAWQYRIIKADTEELYERALNAAGAEGWEAVSSSYSAGESRRVSLGHGMPMHTAIGATQWAALMKRLVP
jgi:hypothetical protein